MKAVKLSLAGPSDKSEGRGRKPAARESEDEPKKKRKKPAETDEVTTRIHSGHFLNGICHGICHNMSHCSLCFISIGDTALLECY